MKVLALVASVALSSEALSSPTSSSRLAVVVATYDRPCKLVRTLRSIERQDIDKERLEVVIVDDTQPRSCRGLVEAVLGVDLESFLAPATLRYIDLDERRTIGAKRTMALKVAIEQNCEVVMNWDDDDLYGDDRLRRQLEETLVADATVLTPCEWRFETDFGDYSRFTTMSWGTPLAKLLQTIDPDLSLGSELVDEAVASLALRISDNTRDLEYPDKSYDEDRDFMRLLKERGLLLRRLTPGEPAYVHVKHDSAVANGPLTRLYTTNLGFLASPIVFLPLVTTTIIVFSKFLKFIFGNEGLYDIILPQLF